MIKIRPFSDQMHDDSKVQVNYNLYNAVCKLFLFNLFRRKSYSPGSRLSNTCVFVFVMHCPPPTPKKVFDLWNIMQASSHSACTQTSVWLTPHASHTCCLSYKSEMKLSNEITRFQLWPQPSSSVRVSSCRQAEEADTAGNKTQPPISDVLHLLGKWHFLHRTPFEWNGSLRIKEAVLPEDYWMIFDKIQSPETWKHWHDVHLEGYSEQICELEWLKKTKGIRLMQAVTMHTVMERSCFKQLMFSLFHFFKYIYFSPLVSLS